LTHTLPADLVSYLLVGVSAFLVIHWLRRAILKPAGASTADPSTGGVTIFDRFQRLFHWGSLVALVITIVTGLALYYPAVLEPAAMAVGFPIHTNFRLLVDVHVASVVGFGVLIAAHIGWDVFKVKGSRKVILSKGDLRQLVVRAESFVRGDEIAKNGKYDVFMKSFHILLTISSIILASTGVTLYFFAPWWLVPQLSHQAIEPWGIAALESPSEFREPFRILADEHSRQLAHQLPIILHLAPFLAQFPP
jgi:cytochrome b subunit of formate dehydrogenase